MRRIGFGLTKRIVKGNEYLYVWKTEGRARKEKVVHDKTTALRLLQRYAEEERENNIKFIDSELARMKKDLGK